MAYNAIDAATWQAIGITLSVVCLVLSFLVWRRRGPASGLRAVGWSLLPAAAGLTGTLRLLWRVANLVVDWAVRLVFSPTVWVGIGLAVVAVLLLAGSGLMRARGIGGRDRPRRSTGSPDQPRLEPHRSAPAAKKPGKPAVQDEDMDDIEAILRKHGIS